MKKLLTLLLIINGVPALAQTAFTEAEFLAVVRKHHPVVKQANIDVRIAQANVLVSKGAFDPKAQGSYAQKTFDGLRYYNQQQYEVEVPTWYGVDLHAGVEKIQGHRVNPEETRGDISYVGFSLPLMQNLVMDKRRAALRQARVLVQQSEAEQRSIVNDLLLDALNTYWTWWQYHRMYRLADSIALNAADRFRMVKTAWKLGDRAAIDTIEAAVQLQTVEMQKNEAFLGLLKAQLELAAFLWKEESQPYELPPGVNPQPASDQQTAALGELMHQLTAHPQLQVYQLRLSGLNIERRLKQQSLLPGIDLKYNQLVGGTNPAKTITETWFQNSYRFGITMAMPLRLSEARGELTRTRLKIEQTRLEQANKIVQLETKLKQAFNEWQQTERQIDLQKGIVKNQHQLQRGEELRFRNGESSLFLVNAREQRTLEAEQKLIQLLSKRNQLLAGLRWSAGLLQ